MLTEERYFNLMKDVKQSNYMSKQQKKSSIINLKTEFYKYVAMQENEFKQTTK